MKKKTALLITITVLVAVLLGSAVVAGTGSPAEEHLNNKIVSQNRDGLRIINEQLEKESDTSDTEAQFIKRLPEKFGNAVLNGYVYQYEMFLNNQMFHDYRFIRAFTEEELKEASFTDDYSRIVIQNETYVIQWGYPGQLPADDGNLPEMDEWTVILRVYTEDNWREGSEIFAKEVYEGNKRDVIIPISEGRASIYSNEDESFIRKLTDSEIAAAKISENGVFVNINGDLFIVTYQFNDDFTEVLEIKLRPRDGYNGDAGALDPGEYQYFTIEEWLY